MRRFSILAATIALLAVSVTPATAGTKDVVTVEARLANTNMFDGGKMCTSDHILHARKVGVTDDFIDTTSGDTIGYMVRSINFNWDQEAPEGEVISQAWGSFVMTFVDPAYGDVPGSFSGSLLSGPFVGSNEVVQLRGWYQLDPGGIPSVGPYTLTFEFTSK